MKTMGVLNKLSELQSKSYELRTNTSIFDFEEHK